MKIKRTEKFIKMENITKEFPGVKALDNANFDLHVGEIHALLGENGAGKSTLMKILSGMYRPTTGTIKVNGKKVVINKPDDAIQNQIGMVYQNFTLASSLTVLENILLGTKTSFFMNTKEEERKVNHIINLYGLNVDLKAKVWQLSVGEKQKVEIIKCFYQGAKVLVLDEPTSVLAPLEVNELFIMMRRVVIDGGAVIFISHKLNEVMAIADRVTVFRKGKEIGTVCTKSTDVKELSRMMVGRDVDLGNYSQVHELGREVLNIESVYAKNDKGLLALNNVSLSLHSGEILGIAAVSGNGQAELAEVITGLRKIEKGSIQLDTGENLQSTSIRKIIDLGVSHIPEKRLDRALVPNFSIAQNLILKDYKKREYKKCGLVLDQNKLFLHAKNIIQKYGIAAPSPNTSVRLLSGGNVQKVLLARELFQNPKIILAVNPTYGLDVGAIEFVQDILIKQKEKGAAILLISEELDEVLRLADRVLVLSNGCVKDIFDRDAYDREKIGLLMAGGCSDD